MVPDKEKILFGDMRDKSNRVFYIRTLCVFPDLRPFMGLFILFENACGIYDVAQFSAKRLAVQQLYPRVRFTDGEREQFGDDVFQLHLADGLFQPDFRGSERVCRLCMREIPFCRQTADHGDSIRRADDSHIYQQFRRI